MERLIEPKEASRVAIGGELWPWTVMHVEGKLRITRLEIDLCKMLRGSRRCSLGGRMAGEAMSWLELPRMASEKMTRAAAISRKQNWRVAWGWFWVVWVAKVRSQRDD